MPIKTYYDRSPMGSTKKTPEGFLVFDAVATRSGIFIYYTPEGQARRAYRAPEEVFSRESMDSFALKPIINNHQKGVTPKMTCDNVKDYQIGQIGENIRRDKNYMRITGCISTKEGIAAVDAGRRGLSLAYDSVDIEEPGVSPSGEPYDYRQTQIRGNHLAIVDAGRAGPEACLHMDTADIFNEDGGSGSGNFGHEGRPGQQGGSGEGMNAGDLEKHIRGKAASGSKMHQRAVELIDKEGLTPHGAYHQAQEEYGHKQDSQDL
ncbi:MAG TPA: DUF2213 domain-containing protein, partial [Chitinivibrionales bacterium]|nr:DUF2213 domain-containing protein [Chitinivibrionales bacterium]